MNNNYLISLGYSIGIIPVEKTVSAIIDIGNDSVMTDIKSFSVWELIFQCITVENYYNKYKNIYNDDDSKKILTQLIDNNLVLKLDMNESLDQQYNLLKDYKLYRQGVGIGMDKEDIYNYKIVNSSEIEVDPIEFSVWANSNAHSKIEDIYNNIDKCISKEKLMIVILSLYHKNLVYFMR